MFFVHGHEEEVMAVGSIQDGLMPLNQPAIYLGNLTGYIEYDFDEDDAFGAHFVERLGQHQILISRNHGYYALGTTAAEAFFRANFSAPDMFDPNQDALDGSAVTHDRPTESGGLPRPNGQF